VIAQDDAARRQFGLPMPMLKEYNHMRGLKPMRKFVCSGLLRRYGILQYTPATNPVKINRNERRRKNKLARRGRGRGQRSSGAHLGFGVNQPSSSSRRGFGNDRGFGRGFGGFGQSFPPSEGYRYPLLHLSCI